MQVLGDYRPEILFSYPEADCMQNGILNVFFEISLIMILLVYISSKFSIINGKTTRKSYRKIYYNKS